MNVSFSAPGGGSSAPSTGNPVAPFTALTGGGASALDGLVTAASATPVNTVAESVVSGVFYKHQLQAGTTAESSPSVIRPDDYNGATNAFVWIRILALMLSLFLAGFASAQTTPTEAVRKTDVAGDAGVLTEGFHLGTGNTIVLDSGSTLTANGTLNGIAGLVANSFTGAQTIAPTTPGTALTLTSGTVTASLPAFNLTQTWNNGAVAFTGALINITNTASAITSKALDIQVGGSSCVNVTTISSSVPQLIITRGPVAASQWMEISMTSGTMTFNANIDTDISWNINTTSKLYLYPYGNIMGLPAATTFGWSSTTSASATRDTIIGRESPAVTQWGLDVNGTAVSQTLKAADGITGTDKIGGALTIASGLGTGAATPPNINFQTGTAVASGTTAQTYTTRFSVTPGGTKTGANGTAVSLIKHGTATLVAGTVTVSDTDVVAGSRIFVNRQTDGGTVGDSYSITITAATNFVIQSKTANVNVAGDTSTVSWIMVNP